MGNTHAVWDHTVLPATLQWWESRLYPQPKQVLNLATPERCKAELTYVMWKQTGWDMNQRPVNRKSNSLPQRHHAYNRYSQDRQERWYLPSFFTSSITISTRKFLAASMLWRTLTNTVASSSLALTDNTGSRARMTDAQPLLCMNCTHNPPSTTVNVTSRFITGPPNGPVLVCWLSSVICCLSSSVTLSACGLASRRACGL